MAWSGETARCDGVGCVSTCTLQGRPGLVLDPEVAAEFGDPPLLACGLGMCWRGGPHQAPWAGGEADPGLRLTSGRGRASVHVPREAGTGQRRRGLVGRGLVTWQASGLGAPRPRGLDVKPAGQRRLAAGAAAAVCGRRHGPHPCHVACAGLAICSLGVSLPTPWLDPRAQCTPAVSLALPSTHQERRGSQV